MIIRNLVTYLSYWQHMSHKCFLLQHIPKSVHHDGKNWHVRPQLFQVCFDIVARCIHDITGGKYEEFHQLSHRARISSRPLQLKASHGLHIAEVAANAENQASSAVLLSSSGMFDCLPLTFRTYGHHQCCAGYIFIL